MGACLATFLVVGCSGPVALPLGVDDDDVVIVAHLGSNGDVSSSEVTTARQPIEVSGDYTALFAIPPGDLLGTEGPIDAEDLRVTSELTGVEGACGRCLFPELDSPMVLRPGDQCRPPAFAKSFLLARSGSDVESVMDPEALARVRSRLRFGPVGDCPAGQVRRLETSTDNDLEVEALYAPPDQAQPVKVFGLAPDGVVGIFDQRLVELFKPDGEVIARRTDVDFLGEVLSALPLGDDFLVMSRVEGASAGQHPGKVRFDRFDRNLGSTAVEPPSEFSSFLSVRRLLDGKEVSRDPGGLPTVIVSGVPPGNARTIVFICTVEAARFRSCSEVSAGRILNGQNNSIVSQGEYLFIEHAQLDSSDSAIGVTKRVESGWQWSEWTLEGEANDLWIQGGRLVICGGSELIPNIVWTASVSRSQLDRGEQPLWREVLSHSGARGCELGVVGSDVIVNWADGQVDSIDIATGQGGPINLRSALGTRRAVSQVESRNGHLAVVDECGSFYAGTSTSLRVVYGLDDQPCFDAAIPGEGSLVRAFGRGIQAEISGGEVTVSEVEGAPNARVAAVARDTSDGSVLLGTYGDPTVVRVQDGAVVASYAVQGLITQIVEVAPGRHLVLSSFEVWEVHGEQATRLELQFGPTDGGCVSALDARGGVAFAGGSCGIRRILLANGELRVDAPKFVGAFTDKRIRALRMLDFDHLVYSDTQGSVWEIQPDPSNDRLEGSRAFASAPPADWFVGNESTLFGIEADDNHDRGADPGGVYVLGPNRQVVLAGVTDSSSKGEGETLVVSQGRVLLARAR